MEIFQSIQIGGLAHEFIRQQNSGTVIGVTSKGLFLKSGWDILFLTTAPYKSPFNVQVKEIDSLSQQIQVGEVYTTTKNSLFFPVTGIRIEIQNATVWSPQLVNNTPIDSNKTVKRISEFYESMKKIAPDKGWFFLRQSSQSEAQSLNELQARIIDNCQAFSNHFKNKNLPGCLDSARQILGLGGGLTPSGDDWITGFILTQTRCIFTSGYSDPFFAKFKEDITDLAFEKTTTISASRIEAAGLGWAEEMFLEVIDSLVGDGKEISEQLITEIVNFGHSSGIDTCMGIFTALETSGNK